MATGFLCTAGRGFQVLWPLVRCSPELCREQGVPGAVVLSGTAELAQDTLCEWFQAVAMERSREPGAAVHGAGEQPERRARALGRERESCPGSLLGPPCVPPCATAWGHSRVSFKDLLRPSTGVCGARADPFFPCCSRRVGLDELLGKSFSL